MTYELMAVLKKIDLTLMEYLEKDKDVESLFTIGEMAYQDYRTRKNNCYKIILIKENENLDSFVDLIEILNNLGKNLPLSSYQLASTIFETQKDFSHEDISKRINLQVEIYTEQEFNNKLSPTLKHQYAKRYRLIYGIDFLKDYQNNVLLLPDLQIDLENFLLAYQDKPANLLHTSSIDEIFPLFNLFFQNIWNYCKLNGYDIPSDKMIFFIRLLGQEYCTNSTLFLLHGIVLKNFDIINSMFKEPMQEINKLLLRLKEQLNNLNEIFKKEENSKTLKLNIYN